MVRSGGMLSFPLGELKMKVSGSNPAAAAAGAAAGGGGGSSTVPSHLGNLSPLSQTLWKNLKRRDPPTPIAHGGGGGGGGGGGAWTEDPTRVQQLMMGASSIATSAKGTALLVKELDNKHITERPLPPGWERCLDLKVPKIYHFHIHINIIIHRHIPLPLPI